MEYRIISDTLVIICNSSSIISGVCNYTQWVPTLYYFQEYYVIKLLTNNVSNQHLFFFYDTEIQESTRNLVRGTINQFSTKSRYNRATHAPPMVTVRLKRARPFATDI